VKSVWHWSYWGTEETARTHTSPDCSGSSARMFWSSATGRLCLSSTRFQGFI